MHLKKERVLFAVITDKQNPKSIWTKEIVQSDPESSGHISVIISCLVK